MATTDTRVLLQALEEYHAALRRHLIEVRTDFDQMQNRWYALSYVYEGDAADQFKAKWALTIDRFREYQERTDAISRVLDERIAALRQVNQTEPGL